MRNFSPWAGLALGVALADQISKRWIMDWMGSDPIRRINAYFDLVLAYNQGAAFSFLANANGWQRYFFSFIALAALLFMGILVYRHAENRRFCLGLSLIMGGALGNLIDRVLVGTVTDFIQWHVGSYYWPAFNLADSAITIGVAILLWDSLKTSK